MITKELYFKSENDAEAARAELSSFRVNDVSLESIPEGKSPTKPFIPIAPGFYGPTGLEAAPLKNKEKLEGKKQETLTHLLRFTIDEKDYDEALTALEKTNGFQEDPEK